MEKLKGTFCNEKHKLLNNFCSAEFLAIYTLESKSCKTCEYKPDELDDNLIENNDVERSYPIRIKLMFSGMLQSKTCQINFYLQKICSASAAFILYIQG